MNGSDYFCVIPIFFKRRETKIFLARGFEHLKNPKLINLVAVEATDQVQILS
jgi:hypothetical protein